MEFNFEEKAVMVAIGAAVRAFQMAQEADSKIRGYHVKTGTENIFKLLSRGQGLRVLPEHVVGIRCACAHNHTNPVDCPAKADFSQRFVDVGFYTGTARVLLSYDSFMNPSEEYQVDEVEVKINGVEELVGFIFEGGQPIGVK